MSEHHNGHGTPEHQFLQMPRAPNPQSDTQSKPHETHIDPAAAAHHRTDDPLVLDSGDWDIMSVSPVAALAMLIQELQSLAHITGEIPPTPPITRSPTPPRIAPTSHPNSLSSTPHDGPSPLSDASPNSPTAVSATHIPTVPIGSPEAQRDEMMPTIEEATALPHADARSVQQAAISRRFFLKSEPSFSLSDYLHRMHKYCPHSPGVYLTAAAWIHRLCVVETLVPATPRTVHRLSLATIRVASKTLEDNKWPQERIARVGGIALHELARIEISLCFLLNFDLFIRPEDLQARMWQLQRTTRQGLSIRKRLSDGFRMRLPALRGAALIT